MRMSRPWWPCGPIAASPGPWNDPKKDVAFARANANSDVLVGEIDGRIVASAMVGHDGHRGMLYYVAVAPGEQGKGYGRTMIAAAEGWLQERQIWKVNLLVRSENGKVRRFYETLGYEISDVFCMA